MPLLRTDRAITAIEYALRRAPAPDDDIDERVRKICSEVIRLRQKCGELDSIDQRVTGLSNEAPAPLN